jgi:hypothetical protein
VEGVLLTQSNQAWVTCLLNIPKSVDVHAESFGDVPHDCEKGLERSPKQRRVVGLEQHSRCLRVILQRTLN